MKFITAILLCIFLMIPYQTIVQGESLQGSRKVESGFIKHMLEGQVAPPFFRRIQVEGKEGKYKITGELRPVTGEFFYSVEDGHVQYVEETKGKVKAKYPRWDKVKININIAKEKLPKNATLFLNFYERNKNGEIIHSYPVVLERFP